jgi:hypothetical protein
MSATQVCLIIFVIIETLNVLELYFMKEKCVFNGVSIFSGWERSKSDPEIHNLINYLINWLAGVKLIVIGLVVVFLFTIPEQKLVIFAMAMVITIASFFWRLYPMIRRADLSGQLTPRGRSRMLGTMVAFLELSLVFTIAADLIRF